MTPKPDRPSARAGSGRSGRRREAQRIPGPPAVQRALLGYRLLLRLYPRELRRVMGTSMREAFRDQCRAAYRRSGVSDLLGVCFRTVLETLRNATAEVRPDPVRLTGTGWSEPAGQVTFEPRRPGHGECPGIIDTRPPWRLRRRLDSRAGGGWLRAILTPSPGGIFRESGLGHEAHPPRRPVADPPAHPTEDPVSVPMAHSVRAVMLLWLGCQVASAAVPALPDSFHGMNVRGRPSSPLGYACPSCNVVLISIDTLRADHLGSYGYPRDTSPRIDEFAADSVTFRTAIAPASSTLLSHASMLTSLSPFQHGAAKGTDTTLSGDAVTMAEIFGEFLYRTVAFVGGGQVDPVYGLDQGFEVYESQPADRFASRVGAALDWIDANPGEPFFLFLHTYEVHVPYEPSPEYFEIFARGNPSKLPTVISVDLIDQLNLNFFGMVSWGPADVQHVINAYDAEIRSVDDAFGRLVDQLKERGLYDQTLIVFTSDHGEEFGEHGAVGLHPQSLHDEVIRVPLIFKLPRSAYASTVVDDLARSIDILPTVLDVMDRPSPGGFQGTSLMEVVTGEAPPPTFAISMQDAPRKASVAVRTQRWKWYDDRLFDLAVDPGEKEDVSSRYPLVSAALVRHLTEMLERPQLTAPESVQPGDDVLQQLRALGYIR